MAIFGTVHWFSVGARKRATTTTRKIHPVDLVFVVSPVARERCLFCPQSKPRSFRAEALGWNKILRYVFGIVLLFVGCSIEFDFFFKHRARTLARWSWEINRERLPNARKTFNERFIMWLRRQQGCKHTRWNRDSFLFLFIFLLCHRKSTETKLYKQMLYQFYDYILSHKRSMKSKFMQFRVFVILALG